MKQTWVIHSITLVNGLFECQMKVNTFILLQWSNLRYRTPQSKYKKIVLQVKNLRTNCDFIHEIGFSLNIYRHVYFNFLSYFKLELQDLKVCIVVNGESDFSILHVENAQFLSCFIYYFLVITYTDRHTDRKQVQ